MSYFDKFDTVKYDFTINTDKADVIDTVQDITRRASLFIKESDLLVLTSPYRISDGERPEITAGKLYGDPSLCWTILFINGITDIYDQWPLSSNALEEYCKAKYGADKLGNIHHWEQLPEKYEIGQVVYQDGVLDLSKSGLIFNGSKFKYKSTPNSSWKDYVTYTNLEHEIRMNDIKSVIRVVRPEYIASFVDLHNKSIINS